MAKTTIVAAMFTVRGGQGVSLLPAESDGGGSGGEKLLVWKREGEEGMNRRPPSITRTPVGWILHPPEQMIKGMEK